MKHHAYTITREVQTEVVVGQRLTKQMLDKLIANNHTAAVIVTDKVLYELFGKNLEQTLITGLKVATHIIPKGEEAKSWNTVTGLLEYLSDKNFDRQVALIALGGGSVSDVCGFGASIYLRGVYWYGCPTTLLAQVDAALGGKTGVNLNNIKNRIGSFYQSRGVFIDTLMLENLPEREFRSGMAEVIKYGVSLDSTLFRRLENEPVLTPKNEKLTEIVKRSAELKMRIVTKDERETMGLRQILNFGHTFGHAVETVAGKGVFIHGEAVAIGMMFAAKLSKEVGLCNDSDVKRVQNVLLKYNLPVSIKSPIDNLIEKMKTDKKVINGRIKWVLLTSLGQVVVDQEVAEDVVKKVLRGI